MILSGLRGIFSFTKDVSLAVNLMCITFKHKTSARALIPYTLLRTRESTSYLGNNQITDCLRLCQSLPTKALHLLRTSSNLSDVTLFFQRYTITVSSKESMTNYRQIDTNSEASIHNKARVGSEEEEEEEIMRLEKR